uniref:DnaJ homolog subfamily B member 9 n=1 Tax=Panagrolaimus davidi TaxID=227884 RepID=A0A914QS91_9BILA
MGNSYSSYKNYYAVLGVRQYANKKEMTKAYHRLALKYHPDQNPSPENEIKIREINEAYHVLVKSKNAQHFEAVDPKAVEENLRMQAEINQKQKTAFDELKELKEQNAIFDIFFSCVKCKTDISDGGILFGCGHNSCVSCSDTSEVCQRCKKLIQKRLPINFQPNRNYEYEAVSKVTKAKDVNQMYSKNAQHFVAVDPQNVEEDLQMAVEQQISSHLQATSKLGLALYALPKNVCEQLVKLATKYDIQCNLLPRYLSKRITEESVCSIAEDLKMANEINKNQKTAIDEPQEQNVDFDDPFCCVDCTTEIGCGHISCDFCSDTFEVYQSCKKSTQYCLPLLL